MASLNKTVEKSTRNSEGNPRGHRSSSSKSSVHSTTINQSKGENKSSSDAHSRSTKMESSSAKQSGEKGILKNKKTTRLSEQGSKKINKDKKKKAKPRKKTTYEKLAQSMGFYVGNVVLKDPRAIEAAQALDLHQNHLRRLRVKFDKIDIDGSGNIDYDEFFESVGETRSPFTDKLFSLIGRYPNHSTHCCFVVLLSHCSI